MDGASIEMDGGRIAAIHEKGVTPPAPGAVFDAEGRMALPGFIDMHIHGAMGFDVTDGIVEAVEAIAESKLKEGVTSFCPTTLTLPEEDLIRTMHAVAGYRVKEPFSRCIGVHLEGPYINPDCPGAQNRSYVRKPDIEELKRLHAITRIAIVTFAVEAEGGLDFIRALTELGIVPSLGHTAATYAQFLRAKEAGLKHLTHFCNQMSRLHHREIGLVGAGFMDDEVLTEMICDRIHLAPDMIALVFKIRPIDRIALVTDAMCAAGLQEGEYALGGLKVRVANGAARLISNNALAGSILHYNTALRNVHEITGLPLSDLVKNTSWNQARSLGLEKTGKIERGFRADLVILDDDFEVHAVFVNGERRV